MSNSLEKKRLTQELADADRQATHDAFTERTYTESEMRLERAAMLRKAAAHPQHHVFSLSKGTITHSECACGIEFPTQGSCAELLTKQRYVSSDTIDKLLSQRDAELKARYLRLAASWRSLAGNPADWTTEGNKTDTAIRIAGRATMIKCAEELENV